MVADPFSLAVTGVAGRRCGTGAFALPEPSTALDKVGFVCRRAGSDQDGRAAWARTDDGSATSSLDDRVAALEADLVVAQQAIAGLTSRIIALEGSSQRRPR
jgi:hypothetical protein